MPNVLDYVREKEPRFKEVPDGELTKYVAARNPEFLQDPDFAKQFDDTLGITAALAKAQTDYGEPTPELPFGDINKKLDLTPGLRQALKETEYYDPDEPVFPLGDFLIQDPKEAKTKTLAGVQESLRNTINGLMTPENLLYMVASMGVASTGRIGAKIVSGFWTAFMGKQAVEHAPEIAAQLGEEMGKPEDQRDQQKIGRLLTDAGVLTTFTALPAAHLVKPAPLSPVGQVGQVMGKMVEKTDLNAIAPVTENAVVGGPPLEIVAPRTAEALTEIGGIRLRNPPKPAVEPKPPLQNLPRNTFAPEVPETLPEPERYVTLIQEIQNAGAKTIADIQRLFPKAQLSREQARELRNNAWGPPEQGPGEAPPPEPTKPVKPKGPAPAGPGVAAPPVELAQPPNPLQPKERRALERRVEEAIDKEADPKKREELNKRLDGIRRNHQEVRGERDEAKNNGDRMRAEVELEELENEMRRLAGEEEVVRNPITEADRAKAKAWNERRVKEIKAKLERGEPLDARDRQDWEIAGQDKKALPPELKPPDPEQTKGWQVTVQGPQKMGKNTVPGYVQIDDISGGKNNWSKSRETLAKEGVDVPDFSQLPPGKYTFEQAKHELRNEEIRKENAAKAAEDADTEAEYSDFMEGPEMSVAFEDVINTAEGKAHVEQVAELEVLSPESLAFDKRIIKQAQENGITDFPDVVKRLHPDLFPKAETTKKAATPTTEAPLPETIFGRPTPRILNMLVTKHAMTPEQSASVLRAMDALPEGTGLDAAGEKLVGLGLVADKDQAKRVVFDLLHRSPEDVAIETRKPAQEPKPPKDQKPTAPEPPLEWMGRPLDYWRELTNPTAINKLGPVTREKMAKSLGVPNTPKAIIDKIKARIAEIESAPRKTAPPETPAPEAPAPEPTASFLDRMKAAKTGDEGREIIHEHTAAIEAVEREMGFTPTVGQVEPNFYVGFSTVKPAVWRARVKEALKKDPERAQRLVDLVKQGHEMAEPWKGLLAKEHAKFMNPPEPPKDAEGKVLPIPNEHGVYPKAAAEAFNYKTKSGTAAIHVLQLPTGEWISSGEYSHKIGTNSGYGEGLSAHTTYGTRDAAIKAAARRIASVNRGALDRYEGRQKAEAQKIAEWADEIAGDRPAQTPEAKRKRQMQSDRPWDLIDEVEGEFGTGKISLAEVRRERPNFQPIGAARKLFSARGKFGPDRALQAIEHKKPFESVDAFLDALNEAAKARITGRAKAAKEKKQLQTDDQQQLAFDKDRQKTGQDKESVLPDSLNEGDEFEIDGTKVKVKELRFDDNGDVEAVILEDGAKYGTRQVEAGTVLNVDKGSVKQKELNTEFLPESEKNKKATPEEERAEQVNNELMRRGKESFTGKFKEGDEVTYTPDPMVEEFSGHSETEPRKAKVFFAGDGVYSIQFVGKRGERYLVPETALKRVGEESPPKSPEIAKIEKEIEAERVRNKQIAAELDEYHKKIQEAKEEDLERIYEEMDSVQSALSKSDYRIQQLTESIEKLEESAKPKAELRPYTTEEASSAGVLSQLVKDGWEYDAATETWHPPGTKPKEAPAPAPKEELPPDIEALRKFHESFDDANLPHKEFERLRDTVHEHAKKNQERLVNFSKRGQRGKVNNIEFKVTQWSNGKWGYTFFWDNEWKKGGEHWRGEFDTRAEAIDAGVKKAYDQISREGDATHQGKRVVGAEKNSEELRLALQGMHESEKFHARTKAAETAPEPPRKAVVAEEGLTDRETELFNKLRDNPLSDEAPAWIGELANDMVPPSVGTNLHIATMIAHAPRMRELAKKGIRPGAEVEYNGQKRKIINFELSRDYGDLVVRLSNNLGEPTGRPVSPESLKAVSAETAPKAQDAIPESIRKDAEKAAAALKNNELALYSTIARRYPFGSPERAMFEKAKEEAKAQTPKLRPGEKVGELLQGEDQPFNLSGEKGIDADRIAREKAEAEKRAREAKELEDKQQTDMFSGEDGPQGAISTGGPALGPAVATPHTIPVKSQRQIITEIAKGLRVPIRFGRLRTNRFAGYFLPRAKLIGSKAANDMPIVTHEAGHALDQAFSMRNDPTLRAELEHLGNPAHFPGSRSSWTPSKTKDYLRGEGVAEFVRYWMTDPAQARRAAPNTYAFFERALDANKDLGDAMRQAQKDIELWRNADPQTRMRSHISVGENPNKTPYTFTQLTRDLVDDLHIIRLAVDDAQRLSGRTLNPSENPYLLARNLRGSYGMASNFIRNGIVDFKTKAVQLGTGLEDALKPVAGRIDDFRDWIVAKRAQELHRQGRTTGMVASDVDAVASKFDADPAFRDAFAKIKRWELGLLRYAVDSGLLSVKQGRAMLRMNRDYVPFHRVFEVGAGEAPAIEGGGTGRGLNVGNPASLRGLRGSPRQIVDPLETMVKNAYALITAAEKAAINEAVVNFSKMPGMGKWVEHIANPKEHVTVGLEKLKQQLEDAGADLTNVPDDLILEFYRNSSKTPFGENIIRVNREGKGEYYRLNRDLFDTFHALNMEDSGTIIKMLSAPAQLLRSGVVLAPDFALANALRDTFSAAVINKYGALPFETTIRGIAALIKDPKAVSEWQAAGGKSAVEASYFDRAKLQEFLKERVTKDLTLAEQAMIVAKSPLAALRYLTGFAEEATRIGEYKIAFNKLTRAGMPEGEARRAAAFEARDRQDFAKGGAKTKIIRHMAAFWNAALQGNVKLAQAFKERPIRTTLQGLAFITTAKLAEQALNWNDKDYWDRPQWERDLFFLIPAGKDKKGHTRFVRIPTPFEVGLIFGTVPGRMLQAQKEKGLDPLASLPGEFAKQTVPNPLPQFLQVAFADFLSGKKGWDIYRGRTVVPESLSDLPPEMQWTDQTSLTARNLGKAIGFSPMKVDHIIAGTTGGMGRQITHQILDRAIEIVSDQKRTASGTLPGGRFVTTPASVSSQSIEDFYKTLETLRAEQARAKAGGAPSTSLAWLSVFEDVQRTLADYRRKSRAKELTEAEREDARELLLQTARVTMDQYRKRTKGQ